MSSFYLVGGTALAVDLVKPLFKPKMTDREEIVYTRIGMCFIGLIGCVLAFQFKAVLDAVIFLGGLYLASALVPVLAALFWKGRRTMLSGFLSLLASMCTTFIWQFILKNPGGISPVIVALPMAAIFFLIGNQIGPDVRYAKDKS